MATDPASNAKVDAHIDANGDAEACELDRAIFEYHSALDRGERPRPADWIARYPLLASGLQAYFDDLACVSLFDFAANPLDDLRSGAVLGDYELLERVGRGGQGSVWKARLSNAHEIVAALKTMHGPAQDDAQAVERFRNDARSLARMTHPNIVRVSYVGATAGRWYLVMELVEGGSLADHLESLRGDIPRAAAIVEKVARAIHHAHTRADGVIHLDLKPGNILLTADGEPKVTDFGLAIRGEHSRHRAVNDELGKSLPDTVEERSASFARAGIVGTLAYMSPEMAAGRWEDVSTLSDVYGLGAVLYALLTGRPPIANSPPSETLTRAIAGEITPPRLVDRRVDRELNAVCLKCLARDPAKRYGSADALANDLHRWRERRATLAGGRPSAWREARFWARRHPGRLAAAMLLTTVLAFLAVRSSFLERRRENADAARQLAGQLDRELRMIRGFTARLAENDALRAALRPNRDSVTARDRRRAAQAVLDNIDLRILFDLAGGNPLVNVLVLDPDGHELADTATKSHDLLPHSFAVRDYVRAFRDRQLPPSHVHVARTFHSIKDGRHKIAVSTRVWDSGGVHLGFVVANFPIGCQLLGFDLRKESGQVAVLCPRDASDPARHQAEPSSAPWSYAIVISRDYAVDRVERPIELAIPELARFQHDRQSVHIAAWTPDGRIADFHRVGDSDLLVMSRRPWP